jgi:hypothetical protein
MQSILFGVSAADPGIYAGISVVLAVVALLATVVPSSPGGHTRRSDGGAERHVIDVSAVAAGKS